MKNIVKVLRLKDNAARIYELPEGVTVKTGTLVSVEFPNRFSTCTGVAVSDSYTVDGETEIMIQQFHHMTPAAWDGMKKVISIYDENPVDWPTDTEDDEEPDDTEETEDEEAE